MATVLDAFVITLGMDPKGYVDGLRKSEDRRRKFGQEEEKADKGRLERNKKFGESFSAVQKQAVGLFATLTASAGIADFTKKMVLTDASAGRLAKNLGMSVEVLSTWSGAVRQMGGTAEDAAQSMQSLSDIQTKAKFGVVDPSQLGAMAQFGLQMDDLTDKSKALLKISAAIQDRKIDPQRAVMLGGMLGLNPATMNLLEEGPAKVQGYLQAQEKAGVATAKMSSVAQEHQRQTALLTSTYQRFGTEVMDDVLPSLDKLLGDFTAMSQSAPTVAKGLGAIALGMIAVGKAATFMRIAQGVGLAGGAGGGAAGAAGAAGAGAAGMIAAATPAIAVGAGVAALAYGGGMDKGEDANYRRQLAMTPEQRKRALYGGKAPLAKQGSSTEAGRANGPPLAKPGVFETLRGGPRLSREEQMAYVEKRLLAGGYSPEVVRGISAGMWAEGGKENARGPLIAETGHHALGVGQWLGPRRRRLLERYGPNPNLSQQTDFLLWELGGGDHGGPAVGKAKTAGHALDAYVRQFMRPGSGTAGDLQRGADRLAKTSRGASAALASTRAGGGNTSTTTISFSGPVTLQTNATDGKSLVRELPGAIRKHSALAIQASSGLG